MLQRAQKGVRSQSTQRRGTPWGNSPPHSHMSGGPLTRAFQMKGRFSEAPPLQRLDGLDPMVPECALILEATKAAQTKGLTLETLLGTLLEAAEEDAKPVIEQWYAQCDEEFTRSGMGKKRAKLEWAQFNMMDAGQAVQNYAAYVTAITK